MSSYTSNRDGGKTNEEGHYRFHVKAWTGNVLSGLQAQAKSPLALGVDITTGDVKVDYSGYGYTAWTDALESVTLTTADPSNPRIDRIVGYIDRGVTPSSAVTNNPGILKFMAVAGTPAGSPSAANDAAVQSAVGASNPWFSIANVLVGTGVTTISSGNITDTRVLVGATLADSSVTTAKINNAAVTNAKLGLTTTNWTPTITPNGSMTYTSVTTVAWYSDFGEFYHIWIRSEGTTGGTAGTGFDITNLPFAAHATEQSLSSIADVGANDSAWAQVSGTTISIRRPAAAAWNLGASRGFIISGMIKKA